MTQFEIALTHLIEDYSEEIPLEITIDELVRHYNIGRTPLGYARIAHTFIIRRGLL